MKRAGELRSWSKVQAAAYLGKPGKGLLPYLYGPYRTQLGRYRPPPRLAARAAFDEPQCEPFAVQPALERLCADVATRLGDRAASRLTVTVLAQGLEHRATRVAKTPLRQLAQVERLARLALEDTQAQPLGIDTLTITLSGLSRPAEQLGLWPQKERVAFAIEVVEARYPGALLKLVPDDPYSLASEHNVRFIARSTGEEVALAPNPTARERRDRQGRPPVPS